LKIAVVAGEGLGNVIMATPAVRAVAALGHHVDFLLKDTARSWVDAFDDWDEIDECRTVEERIVGYDAVCRTAWGSGGHVAKNVPVYCSPRVKLLRKHEIDVNMLAVEQIGCFGPPPAPWVGHDTPGNWRGLGPGGYWVLLTACNPGLKWARKLWHGWERLAEELPGKCVFVGARHDSRDYMSDVGLNLCGKVPLREALGWIKHARGAVGIDCGLAHAAAALGTPTIVLYGPTSDSKNRQIGPNVRLLRTSMDCAPCQFTERWIACKSWDCMGHSRVKVISALLEETGG
jgi:hypothetical protein